MKSQLTLSKPTTFLITKTYKTLALVAILFSISFSTYAQNVSYYINTDTGNDANNGLTTGTAWKTINKANAQNLQAGDKLLFNSDGSWHNGKIYFDANDVGTPANPIVVDKYGTNPRAVIYGGSSEGLYSVVAGIKIQNMEFYGARMFSGSNTTCGIEFYRECTTTTAPYIFIDNCKLEGFGKVGIFFIVWNNGLSNPRGFSDITVKNTSIFNCANAGLQVYAFGNTLEYRQTIFQNILIDNVRASRNAGSTNITSYATGNGILVSQATNVTIQNCVADRNGEFDSSTAGAAGIAGIWFYDVNNGIIQNCEAFENYSSRVTDGNGFGIDGGCQNCIIQYCYSHDNQGAGFGLFQFGGTLNPHTNNTIRYNVSQNDARKNAMAGIYLWANNNTTEKISNDNIYNNTIYLDANNLLPTAANTFGHTTGIRPPVGIKLLQSMSGCVDNVKVYNNIFYLDDADANLAFSNPADYSGTSVNVPTNQILMQNNQYYKASNPVFKWGSTYNSLSAWRTGTNQEKVGGSGANTGITTDPGLIWPGKAGTVVGAITGSAPSNVPLLGGGSVLTTISAYKLKTGGTAIGAGVRLNVSPYSLSIGSTDYYGNPLAAITAFDIGANEAILTATGDNYRSSTAGCWNTALLNTWNVEPTWESFTGSVWQSATVAPSSASGTITIQSPHTVSVSSAVTADQLTINSGGQLTINSGQTFTVNNGAGTDVNVTGILQNSGTITNTAGLINFNSGGQYNHAFTTTGGTIPTATWLAGSTCNVAGYTTNSIVPAGISGQNFQNFTWNNPSQTTAGALGADINIAGNLTLTAGTLNLGSNKLTYSGNSITRTSGSVNATAGTVEFTNPTTVDLTISPSVFTSNTISNLTKNGWGHVFANNNLIVPNTLTLTMGTLYVNAGTSLTLGGNIIGSGTNQGWLRTSATSSLVLNSSSAITLPNAVAPMWTFLQEPSGAEGITNLTLSGTGAVNLGSALTVENGLTTNSGSSLVIGANNTLTLNGTITSSTQITGSATSSINIGGSGAASIGLNQTSAATRSLLNYTQSRNATVTLSNPTLINGVVNLSGTNSILASGTGNLTLVSTATTTSSIAALATASGANVSGLVNVQSFFTGGNANARGTRMISSPVNDASNSTTDSTVFQQLKNRMLITGPGGASNGFDVGTGPGPNAPNLVTYNEPVTSAVSQFNNVPNILFGQKIAVGQNYFLFFRGNRTSPANKYAAPFTIPENVTMTYEGTINKGTIPINISKTNNSDANYDGLNAIGNPYPSTIDFDAFRATNSSIIDNMLSIIKPDKQGMVTYSNGVTVNNTQPYNTSGGTASALPARYIQPGQGFYIRATNVGTGQTINFMESHKVAATSPPAPARLLIAKPSKNTFATAERKVFRMKLQSPTSEEETAIVFEDGFKADFDNADAPYLGNNSSVLNTLDINNNALAINFMPAINTVDEIPLTVNTSQTATCNLQFTDISPANNKTIILKDNYLNSETEINEANKTYSFTIDKNVAATFGNNRLVLKFNPKSLPIDLLSFKASKINAGTLLAWKTLSEKDNKAFIIEKSTDGKTFNFLSEIKAKGNGTTQQNYSHIDNNPVLGLNYYKLKQIDNNGTENVVGFQTVNYTDLSEMNESLISVYPNPVVNILTVILPQSQKQDVTLEVFDVLGKSVVKQNYSKNINLEINVSQLPKGAYAVKIKNSKTRDLISVKKFIKE